MKLQYFFTSIVFIFFLVDLKGQESNLSFPQITEEVYATSFNWKPFSIELNSSSVGHGIAIEKDFIKNMAFRVGVASDFKSGIYDSAMGYKINFGVMYDVFNYRFLSLRTGVDLGMRKVSDVDYNYGLLDYFIVPEPVSAGFIDIPVLLQYNITKNISIEIGIRNMFQKAVEFNEMITTGRVNTPFNHYFEIDKRLHSYHFGLQYTFTE